MESDELQYLRWKHSADDRTGDQLKEFNDRTMTDLTVLQSTQRTRSLDWSSNSLQKQQQDTL